jgi:hypothetical protein
MLLQLSALQWAFTSFNVESEVTLEEKNGLGLVSSFYNGQAHCIVNLIGLWGVLPKRYTQILRKDPLPASSPQIKVSLRQKQQVRHKKIIPIYQTT